MPQTKSSKYGPDSLFRNRLTCETWGILQVEFLQQLTVSSDDYVFEGGCARPKILPTLERKLNCSHCKEEFQSAEALIAHLESFQYKDDLLTQSVNLPIEGMDAARNQTNQKSN